MTRIAPERAGGRDLKPRAIAELEKSGPLDAPAVDRFLAEHTFPIVEGPCITFVYRGEADAVQLGHGVYGLPGQEYFRRLDGTDLWYIILEFPEDSRVEYKLVIERGGRKKLIEDPLNDKKSYDPFGANSVVHGAAYRVPEWTQEDPEARRGTVEELNVASQTWGAVRRVSLYQPARYRPSARYPLMVVHDGGDFLNFASIRTVLDNLIHRYEIPEMVVALTHPDERLVEYAADERHARYLAEELVPKLEEMYPLRANPHGRCLMGSSFGAVASLSTAWRYPGLFGRLLLQSGSFAFTDIGPHRRGPSFDPVVSFMNEFRRQPKRVADKVFLSCGIYESLIYENRSLVPFFQSTGMEVKYVEAYDGHNWENWRDRLREGLSWLFPGPLWMVYE